MKTSIRAATIKRYCLSAILALAYLAAPSVQASSEEDIARAYIEKYTQWYISPNTRGQVLPGQPHSIKGVFKPLGAKFLQYEKQGSLGGINLGWTDDASAATEQRVRQWVIKREGNWTGPIVYGEKIAIAWRDKYIKYGHRTVGINLKWSSSPAYEWVIAGGQVGSPVHTGRDRVLLYNLTHQEPLIYFNRPRGGDIGWPDSGDWPFIGNLSKAQMKTLSCQYVTGYVEHFARLCDRI